MYEKLKNVAKVVAKLAPAAINSVLTLVQMATISTIIIVSVVLKICSTVCDLAVADIFCLPLKYPRIN